MNDVAPQVDSIVLIDARAYEGALSGCLGRLNAFHGGVWLCTIVVPARVEGCGASAVAVLLSASEFIVVGEMPEAQS